MEDRLSEQKRPTLPSNSKKFLSLSRDQFLITRPKQTVNFQKGSRPARLSADQQGRPSGDNSI